jgi:hypothetical protein
MSLAQLIQLVDAPSVPQRHSPFDLNLDIKEQEPVNQPIFSNDGIA